jgi:hypothetical protein
MIVVLTEEILRSECPYMTDEQVTAVLNKYKYYDSDAVGFHVYSETYAKEKGLITDGRS